LSGPAERAAFGIRPVSVPISNGLRETDADAEVIVGHTRVGGPVESRRELPAGLRRDDEHAAHHVAITRAAGPALRASELAGVDADPDGRLGSTAQSPSSTRILAFAPLAISAATAANTAVVSSIRVFVMS
jgi:hypothetical protein